LLVPPPTRRPEPAPWKLLHCRRHFVRDLVSELASPSREMLAARLRARSPEPKDFRGIDGVGKLQQRGRDRDWLDQIANSRILSIAAHDAERDRALHVRLSAGAKERAFPLHAVGAAGSCQLGLLAAACLPADLLESALPKLGPRDDSDENGSRESLEGKLPRLESPKHSIERCGRDFFKRDFVSAGHAELLFSRLRGAT
jgi:hypothetical protein